VGVSNPKSTSTSNRTVFREGAVGWWKQITAAIDSVDFLIPLMTPAALASGNVQKEWRFANGSRIE